MSGDGAAKAILLDALGTLVALEPPAPLLRTELAERFGVRVSEAEAERAIAAEIAYYRGHLDEGRDAESLARLRERCAAVLRSALPPGPELSATPPAAMTEALLASLRFRAFPDAAPALAAARAGGRRLVVVSNWDVSLSGVLGGLGLAELVDGIVTSAAAGVRKPAPAIFARALAVAGAGPDDAVHVGDSLEEDVAGARGAGIEPVLIRRDGGAVPGVATIASLAELANAISNLPAT
jgi:putative hydrolase of the HAD superfamily